MDNETDMMMMLKNYLKYSNFSKVSAFENAVAGILTMYNIVAFIFST